MEDGTESAAQYRKMSVAAFIEHYGDADDFDRADYEDRLEIDYIIDAFAEGKD